MSDSEPFVETDIVSTRVVTNRQLVCDGAAFEWWAVGDDPSLVTVRSQIFGSLQAFTHGDIAVFAMSLARKLLDEHYARAEQARRDRDRDSENSQAPEPESPPSAREKPGWFE